GEALLEVFQDGERLPNLDFAVEQGRHQALGVDPAVGLGEVLAALEAQIHRDVVERQALELERDAGAKGRGARVEVVELQAVHLGGRRARPRPALKGYPARMRSGLDGPVPWR